MAAGGLAIFMVLALVSALGDQLTQPEIVESLVGDMAKLVGGSASPRTPMFSLLRDWPSLLLVVSATASAIVVLWQFRLAVTLWKQLAVRVVDTDQDPTELVGPIGIRVNGSFRQIGNQRNRLCLLFVSLSLAGLLSLAERHTGVYSLLGPRDASRDWASEAYDHWWASWSASPAGATLYLLIVAALVYLVLVHIAVGVQFVSFFRAAVREVVFRPDYYNVDGHFGWLYLRRCIASVSVGLFFYSAIAALILLQVAPNLLTFIVCLTTVVVLNSLYILIPIWAIRRSVMSDRVKRIDGLVMAHRTNLDLSTPRDNEDLRSRNEVADYIELLNRPPNGPYRPGGAFVRLLPTVFALVTAIVRAVK